MVPFPLLAEHLFLTFFEVISIPFTSSTDVDVYGGRNLGEKDFNLLFKQFSVIFHKNQFNKP